MGRVGSGHHSVSPLSVVELGLCVGVHDCLQVDGSLAEVLSLHGPGHGGGDLLHLLGDSLLDEFLDGDGLDLLVLVLVAVGLVEESLLLHCPLDLLFLLPPPLVLCLLHGSPSRWGEVDLGDDSVIVGVVVGLVLELVP